VRRVNISLTLRVRKFNDNAAIGIGSLIIFIAMILVAGIAASVMIQTMTSLQEQALSTGTETIRDVSSGVRVSHVSGYYNGTSITQLAVFVRTTAGSGDIDLNQGFVSLSDTNKQVILNYTTNVYSSSVSAGLFGTLNDSALSATTYGIMIIRDTDGSCGQDTPTINSDDLIVLLINATDCFSGIGTREDISGFVNPEQGMNGVIRFTTPSAFIDTIVELQ
jgi:flagellin FlaB